MRQNLLAGLEIGLIASVVLSCQLNQVDLILLPVLCTMMYDHKLCQCALRMHSPASITYSLNGLHILCMLTLNKALQNVSQVTLCHIGPVFHCKLIYH